MNKKLIAGLTFGVMLMASVIAYQILTITTHYTVTESQDMSYSDDGITYNPLTAGIDNDLGAYTIGAGEEQPTYLQGDNTANRDLMYVYTITNVDPLLRYDFDCSVSGTEYYVESGQNWGEGIVVKVKAPASSVTENIIKTTASAESPVGMVFEKVITPDRKELDSSPFVVCP